MGAVGAVAAGRPVSLAAVGLVAAREARIEQSLARTVIGGRVTGRGSAVRSSLPVGPTARADRCSIGAAGSQPAP